jgi:hypothetical protein
MKVYVLTWWYEYADKTVLSVHSSQEKAEAARDRHKGDEGYDQDYDIVEMELDGEVY